MANLNDLEQAYFGGGNLNDAAALAYAKGSAAYPFVGAQSLGIVASLPGTYTDAAPAINAAITSLKAGQAILLNFDPNKVDASGNCNYCIASPICLTQEIPIFTTSQRVRITAVGSLWGSTYFHMLRNWGLTEAGYTESKIQAPNTTATPTTKITLDSLDTAGLRFSANGISNIAMVSLLHPHEQSRINISGNSGASNSAFAWGIRAVQIFSNNDTVGVTAGPIIVKLGDFYGFGYDHLVRIDGTNNGTTTLWAQDVRISGGTTPSQSGTGTFRGCFKSPFSATACNGLILDNVHCESVPCNAPPAAGTGLWQALTAYAVGARVIVKSSDAGTNQGLGSMAICTTAGTSGAAAPTWTTPGANGGQTVNDGSIVWTIQSFSTSSGGNGNGGILDAALSWPGAGITVPLGTHISPDGLNGWLCTTTGITTAVQPAFLTAGDLGSTQVDGTVIWTYVIDNYDQAVIRLVDVGHNALISCRQTLSYTGTNQPYWKSNTTGTAPQQFAANLGQNMPDIFDFDIELSGVVASGLSSVFKGQLYGSWFIYAPNGGSTQTLAYSTPSFDPRHIVSASGGPINFYNGNALTPTTFTFATNAAAGNSSRSMFKKSSTAFTPNATLNTLGTAVTLSLADAGYSGCIPSTRIYSPSGVAGETITIQVIITWSDGTTTTTTSDATATNNNAINTLPAAWFKDGVYPISAQFQVKSSINSSAASVTVQVLGTSV